MDLRDAFNAVSDVVANRSPPLREFDQIYMKVADMVIQAEYVGRAFGKTYEGTYTADKGQQTGTSRWTHSYSRQLALLAALSFSDM